MKSASAQTAAPPAVDQRKDFAERLARRFEALLPHPSHCTCNQQTQREHVQFCSGWYWETAIKIVKKELAECEKP